MEQELNRKTMVIGHRNPDTDSICSAIAYSYLLNATNKYNAVPVRLGEINRETEYVLKRFWSRTSCFYLKLLNKR